MVGTGRSLSGGNARARMRRRCAFTLIELLVVMTIIALLVAMLLPSLSRSMQTAKAAVCMARQRQIAVAWLSYATDNNSQLVGSHCSVNSTYAWTNPHSGHVPETEQDLKDGKLWTYLNNVDIYRCPVDPRGYLRSYSMSMYVGGIGGWYITPVQSMGSVIGASRRLLTLDEADPRGANLGAWAIYPATDPTHKEYWIDWPASWHFDDSNVMSFCDGHVEFYRFQNPATTKITGFYTYAPNNVDLDYFQQIYVP
ncbi:MAG: prepilin-type N-terminal cleavage/methylation domain-containing protein [Planctomycetes bacterium]|nr:prepilin-type N-terminal cleavage/methylation domain-containing protein [Planctomycetota bacterium]